MLHKYFRSHHDQILHLEDKWVEPPINNIYFGNSIHRWSPKCKCILQTNKLCHLQKRMPLAPMLNIFDTIYIDVMLVNLLFWTQLMDLNFIKHKNIATVCFIPLNDLDLQNFWQYLHDVSAWLIQYKWSELFKKRKCNRFMQFE